MEASLAQEELQHNYNEFKTFFRMLRICYYDDQVKLLEASKEDSIAQEVETKDYWAIYEAVLKDSTEGERILIGYRKPDGVLVIIGTEKKYESFEQLLTETSQAYKQQFHAAVVTKLEQML
jgi:hypothetical protein